MPQGIVDDLETVQIDKHDGKLLPVAFRALHSVAQQLVEHEAVGQFRQSVMRRQIFDLFFLAFALGNIAGNPAKPDRLPVGPFDQRRGNGMKRFLAVFPDQLQIVGFHRYARFVNLIEESEQRPGVFFIGILPAVHADQLPAGIAEISALRVIDKGKITGKVHLKITVLHLLDDAPVALFGLAQRLLHLFAVADIAGNAAEPDRLTPAVPDERNRNFGNLFRAVLSDDFHFKSLHGNAGVIDIHKGLIRFPGIDPVLELAVAQPQQLLPGIPHMPADHVIDKREGAGQINLEIAVLDRLDHRPVLLFVEPQAFFHLFALGDVAHDPVKPGGRAPGVPAQRHGRFQMLCRSVPARNLPVEFPDRFACFEDLVERLEEFVRAFLVHVLPVIQAHQLFFGVFPYPAQGVVEKREVARQVHFVIAFFDIVQNAAIFDFTFPQHFHGMAVRDVLAFQLPDFFLKQNNLFEELRGCFRQIVHGGQLYASMFDVRNFNFCAGNSLLLI